MTTPDAAGDQLPDYTTSPGPARTAPARCSHSYSLENKGRAWLTLKIANSRALNPKHLPVFHDADTIEGSVEVDLDKAESAKGLSIAIVAATTFVGQDEFQFLNVEHELWSGASGGKLKGKMSWPFIIAIPTTVEAAIEEKGPKTSHPTPPTYTERASPAYIDYKLTVTVKRGMFKVNQSLGTSIAYLPRSQAKPPSGLRQLAYAEGGSLAGPHADPSGWKIFPDIVLKGTLFEKKEVEMSYSFAVASPLSYAAGMPIPVLCSLRCEDEQALDLLAQSTSVGLLVARTLAVGTTAMDVAAQQTHTTFKEVMAKAHWWPSDHGVLDVKPGSGVRHVQGEVQLRKIMKPSSVFPRLSVYYHLVFVPPKTAGFTPELGPATQLLVEPIEVCTDLPTGPAPRSHAPPGYVHEQEGDYSTSVGLLENGNQRFLGHVHAQPLSA